MSFKLLLSESASRSGSQFEGAGSSGMGGLVRNGGVGNGKRAAIIFEREDVGGESSSTVFYHSFGHHRSFGHPPFPCLPVYRSSPKLIHIVRKNPQKILPKDGRNL